MMSSTLLLVLILLNNAFSIEHKLTKPLVTIYKYETKYFDTYLDHFNYVNDVKFKLRYLINEDHFQPNSSILFYTGNEGDITIFAENTGFLWEAAEALNSTIIFIEHRYYGESMPFGKDSFKDRYRFGYLTAEQALSDFALVLTHIKSSPKYKNVPVIAMGGSYGGMLTAWMRQKYPNIVVGGLAASAPIFGFTGMRNCSLFSKVATDAYKKAGGEECPDRVRSAWVAIDQLSKQSGGLNKLSTIFKTCDPLFDASDLTAFIQDFLGSLTMVNYPYPTNFLYNLPGYPLKNYCQVLNGSNDILHSFSKAFWAIFNYKGSKQCLDLLDGQSSGLDASGWTLQTCLEMTIPMCNNNVTDMFPPQPWSDKDYSDFCQSNFKVRPRTSRAQMEWWGEDAKKSVQGIIFSNGDLDPWSGLGVQSEKEFVNSFYFRLPNGAHHLDLRASNPLDPEDIKKARKTYLKIFKLWISQHYNSL